MIGRICRTNESSPHSRRPHHRRRTRRLRRRDPLGPARLLHRLRRGRQDTRRHVRERRLHPVEGAAPIVRAPRVHAAARRGTRIFGRRRDAEPRADDEAQGRRRRREHARRRVPLQEEQDHVGQGLGRARGGQHRPRHRRRRQRDDLQAEERHHRDRLGSDRTSVPQVRRRARALEHRRAENPRSPEASHRHRRRRDRPRARLRLAPARREGHGHRVRADDPARQRRRDHQGSGQDLPQAGPRDPHERESHRRQARREPRRS